MGADPDCHLSSLGNVPYIGGLLPICALTYHAVDPYIIIKTQQIQEEMVTDPSHSLKI